MKKLLFGMAFTMGVMMFNSINLQAGEDVELNKKVCCLEPDEFCTDFLGGAWADSIEKPGPYCP